MEQAKRGRAKRQGAGEGGQFFFPQLLGKGEEGGVVVAGPTGSSAGSGREAPRLCCGRALSPMPLVAGVQVYSESEEL